MVSSLRLHVRGCSRLQAKKATSSFDSSRMEEEELSVDKLKDLKLKNLDGEEVSFSTLWQDRVSLLL